MLFAAVKIEVRLFANLARYLPPGTRGGATTLEVPADATLASLVGRLAIPDDLPRLMLVNGRDATPGHRLVAGDVVILFPPLVGG